MPKYYCESGNFKKIIDAPDKDVAIKKFINKALTTDNMLSFIAKISELGFNSIDQKICAVIPILRETNFSLPDNNKLIQMICDVLKIDPNMLDEKMKNWLLYKNEDNLNEQ